MASSNLVLQGQAVEELHDHEGLSVLLVNLVDGTDIRMVQGRSCFGFAPEALQSMRVMGYDIGQNLEGNEAIQLDIFGLVDYPHSAAA